MFNIQNKERYLKVTCCLLLASKHEFTCGTFRCNNMYPCRVFYVYGEHGASGADRKIYAFQLEKLRGVRGGKIGFFKEIYVAC